MGAGASARSPCLPACGFSAFGAAGPSAARGGADTKSQAQCATDDEPLMNPGCGLFHGFEAVERAVSFRIEREPASVKRESRAPTVLFYHTTRTAIRFGRPAGSSACEISSSPAQAITSAAVISIRSPKFGIWFQHVPACLDTSLLEVDRISCACVGLEADGVASRRRVDHNLANRRSRQLHHLLSRKLVHDAALERRLTGGQARQNVVQFQDIEIGALPKILRLADREAATGG